MFWDRKEVDDVSRVNTVVLNLYVDQHEVSSEKGSHSCTPRTDLGTLRTPDPEGRSRDTYGKGTWVLLRSGLVRPYRRLWSSPSKTSDSFLGFSTGVRWETTPYSLTSGSRLNSCRTYVPVLVCRFEQGRWRKVSGSYGTRGKTHVPSSSGPA